MTQTMLKVHNLVKRCNGFTAVEDFSFEVYEEEIFGLLGPNGAGNTTPSTASNDGAGFGINRSCKPAHPRSAKDPGGPPGLQREARLPGITPSVGIGSSLSVCNQPSNQSTFRFNLSYAWHR